MIIDGHELPGIGTNSATVVGICWLIERARVERF